MEVLVAIILGIVQGLTEFLPISSTGHLVLVQEFLGVADVYGLSFDAILHLATALAVGIYFFKDFLRIAYAFLYRITGRPVNKEDEKLLWLLVVGTIPAAVLGFFLEGYMETVFRSAILVAWTLIVGALVFLAAEWFSKRYMEKEEVPTFAKAIGIGFFQALALIPGMSRSGMTISGGLFLGLSREAAARFGFMLSLPIILGSGGKKFLELLNAGAFDTGATAIIWGSIAAFVSGLIAIHFLLRFVKNHSLTVFAVYRIILAVIVLWWFV
ncbi:MAG: undecaprenyl-diphosphatase UppP [Patescibacteria group bacterium UBA2103]